MTKLLWSFALSVDHASPAGRKATAETMQIFGQHEKQTLEQLSRVAARAEHAALMADGHLGYVMPIGGVAAYQDQVSVAGVGFDIACGNAAIRTNLQLHDLAGRSGGLRRHLEQLGDEIRHGITFGIGGTNPSRGRTFGPSPVRGPDLGGGPRPTPLHPAGQGTQATRHGGIGEPLCRRLRRRAGAHLGGRPLRLPGLRPHRRLLVSGDRAGRRMGPARARNGGHPRPGTHPPATTTGA